MQQETFPYETLQPLDLVLSTPSPVLTFSTEDPSVQDLRSQAVPCSWIWNQLALHFPELTTTTGLSDEIIQVIYNERGTYKIKTRSLGEYWLVTDSSNEVVVPIHFPLLLSATPSP